MHTSDPMYLISIVRPPRITCLNTMEPSLQHRRRASYA